MWEHTASYITLSVLFSLSGLGCAGMGRPPTGSSADRSPEQRAAAARIRGKIGGMIAWSSSRAGNHDLYLMRPDGSGITRLTKGEHVDWYPRFDSEGKRLLFTRSKRGWVSEKDANRPEKWDLYLIGTDGKGLKKVASNASWGVWIGRETILFARGTKIVTKTIGSDQETIIVDSTQVPSLGGALLQNPHLSPDGKWIAITLRGAKRETGIYDREQKAWTRTGAGCQINLFPAADRIYWVNPSGNGGSEVFSVPLTAGKPTREHSYQEKRFIDIPGRRSHEYFPQVDRSGRWLVWAATRRGHDHDIADYEIYIWQIGAPPAEATRLTFQSGNDRWPDIFVAPAQK